MTDFTHRPDPFVDFKPVPNKLNRSGMVERPSMTTHYTDAAIRAYRQIGGQPTAQGLIVDAPSRIVRETPGPERDNNNGLAVPRSARLIVR